MNILLLTKAAVNAPQSRRFANLEDVWQSRSVWSAACSPLLSSAARCSFFKPRCLKMVSRQVLAERCRSSVALRRVDELGQLALQNRDATVATPDWATREGELSGGKFARGGAGLADSPQAVLRCAVSANRANSFTSVCEVYWEDGGINDRAGARIVSIRSAWKAEGLELYRAVWAGGVLRVGTTRGP